jgi:uncharacterized membrane protein YbhN (UPF0104 family)
VDVRRRRVVAALRILAFAACLALFVHALAHAHLRAALARIEALGPIVLVLLVPFPFALLCDAAAWRRLLLALGRDVPIRTLFRVRVAIEALTNSTPAGAVWADAVAPLLVARRASAPVADVFAASTAKRWLIIRTHGLYVALAAAFGAQFLADASTALVGNHALGLMIVAGALALVVVSHAFEWTAAKGRVAGRVSAMIGRARFARVKAWIEARHHQFEHADEQIAKLSSDKRAAAAAAGRMMMLWLVEGLETFLILRLLGAPLGLVEVMSFDAALSVVRSVVIFAPAGIGVQDVGYLAVLDAYGVPDASGVGPAFVVLKRAKEVVWIAIGLVVLARSGARRPLSTAET